jgi:hypothetical protein
MIYQFIQIVTRLAVTALIFTSCSTSKDFKGLYPNMKQEDFIKSYQVAFVCGCINAGSNNNFNKFLKENNDLGLFSEVEFLSHGVVKEADSLGRVYANKVRPINYGDAGDRKPYFSRCIYLSQSREVYTLIKSQYKKLKKAKLTYEYEID